MTGWGRRNLFILCPTCFGDETYEYRVVLLPTKTAETFRILYQTNKHKQTTDSSVKPGQSTPPVYYILQIDLVYSTNKLDKCISFSATLHEDSPKKKESMSASATLALPLAKCFWQFSRERPFIII